MRPPLVIATAFLFSLFCAPECDAAYLRNSHFQRPRQGYPQHKTIKTTHLRPERIHAASNNGPISYRLGRGQGLQRFRQTVPQRGAGRHAIHISSRPANPFAAGRLPRAQSVRYRATPSRQPSVYAPRVNAPVLRYR